MPSRLKSPEGRSELISLFDERIHTPSAYIEVPNKEDLIEKAIEMFEMHISDRRIGHGALILLQMKGFKFEAVPFGLDPSIAENPNPADFVYGFHKYVTRDAYAEIDKTISYDGFSMNMWHSDDGKIVAIIGEDPTFFTPEEIEAIRQLSLRTSDVEFLADVMKGDVARIKIMGGLVMMQANDSSFGEWAPYADTEASAQ